MGMCSYRYKLDLVTVQGTLIVNKYSSDIQNPIVVPHFDNHPLRRRPLYMDDDARYHTVRTVVECLQQEAM